MCSNSSLIMDNHNKDPNTFWCTVIILTIIWLIIKFFFDERSINQTNQSFRSEQFNRHQSSENNERGGIRGHRHEWVPPRVQQNRKLSIPRQRSEIAGELPEFVHKLSLETYEAAMIKDTFSRFSRNKDTRLEVRNIFKVVNPVICKMYKLKKEEVTSRDGQFQEMSLFHGTKRENLRSICVNNFDWRRCGASVGHKFGQGVSFTPKASYALHYCDRYTQLKAMFLANVLYKTSIIGNKEMIIPAVRQYGQRIIYDASRNEDGSVIVKYCDNEFYPKYIIYFECVPEVNKINKWRS